MKPFNGNTDQIIRRKRYLVLIMGIIIQVMIFFQTASATDEMVPYPVVDTGQIKCYENFSETECPLIGDSFYGQDSQNEGTQPAYIDNGDGTVTDINTGLMWQQDPGEKMTYDEAVAGAESFELAGYSDWRLPTVKELYSLILFSGTDPSGLQDDDTSGLTPFINTDYFHFKYGDPAAGERIIDSQWATSTRYVSTTMNNHETMFGVNFADGRIKGYPIDNKTYFVIYVRGNMNYGMNHYIENGDGTVTDISTGLMWVQSDSGHFGAGDYSDGALNWEQALAWAESLEYAGYSDWRLPDAKELQSIVDYTRSPATTDTAAIDPVFESSYIIDEGGDINYPFYWTSTTHANTQNGGSAVYIAFGEALGWMQDPFGNYFLMDVHGAGAQRSDPKLGNPADYPYGHGPQGDVIRIYNYVRCVRDVNSIDDEKKDSDGDGIFDDLDGCPYDPEKISPGMCGCGLSDVDTDWDGAPDCSDNCPDDPDKIEPGSCGCGNVDTDSDKDGTPDCLELKINVNITPVNLIAGLRHTIDFDCQDGDGKRLGNVVLRLSGCGVEKEILAKKSRVRLRRVVPTEPGEISVTATKEGYFDFIGSITVNPAPILELSGGHMHPFRKY